MGNNVCDKRKIRDLYAALVDAGFELVRKSGSHKIFKKEGQTVVVNKDLNVMVYKRICKEIGWHG